MQVIDAGQGAFIGPGKHSSRFQGITLRWLAMRNSDRVRHARELPDM